jgi:hypothetical protein
MSDQELVALCQSDDTYQQEYVEELKRRGWAESHPNDGYDPEDESCATVGCEWPAGHEVEHPCGQRLPFGPKIVASLLKAGMEADLPGWGWVRINHVTVDEVRGQVHVKHEAGKATLVPFMYLEARDVK